MSFVDLRSGNVTNGPELPAELVGGLRFSRDGTRLALTISGAAAPPDVWVMEVGTKSLRQVTQVPHVGVDLAQLVRPELVKFKAHDGLEVSGWLYRPKGRAGPRPTCSAFTADRKARNARRSAATTRPSCSRGLASSRRTCAVRQVSGKVRQSRQRRAAFRWLEDIKSCVDYLVSTRSRSRSNSASLVDPMADT